MSATKDSTPPARWRLALVIGVLVVLCVGGGVASLSHRAQKRQAQVEYLLKSAKARVGSNPKDTKAAIVQLTRAIEFDASAGKPWATRGWAHLEAGDRHLAIADLERALELLDPDESPRLVKWAQGVLEEARARQAAGISQELEITREPEGVPERRGLLQEGSSVTSEEVVVVPRRVDAACAELLRAAGVARLRLSHETRDEDLRHLAGLTTLRELRIDVAAEWFSGEGLRYLRELPELRRLELGPLEPAGIANLGQLERLDALSLELAGSAKPPSLEPLASLGGLREVRVTLLAAREQDLAGLSQLPLLTSLSVSSESLTDKSLGALGALTQLQDLSLAGCPQAGDATLAQLSACTSLRALDLAGCAISDAGLASLAGLSKLTWLDLSGCEGLSDAGVEELAKLKGLRYLDLSACAGVGDRGLRALAELRELRVLRLRGCGEVGDAGLKAISALPLRLLDLERCAELSDAGIKSLEDHKRLEAINLLGCLKVSDAGVVALASARELRWVNLLGCAQVSDLGLKALAGLPALEALDLSGSGVTDAGLRDVSGAKALTTLGLQRCAGITPEGVRRLSALTKLRSLRLEGCAGIPAAEATALLASLEPEGGWRDQRFAWELECRSWSRRLRGQ